MVSPSTRTRPFTGTPPRTVSEIPSMFELPTWIEVRAAKFFPGRFTWAITKYDPGVTPRNSKIPCGFTGAPRVKPLPIIIVLRAESITLRFVRCGFSPAAGGRISLTARPVTVTVCILASAISILRNCAPGAMSMGAAAAASVARGKKVVTYSSSVCGATGFGRMSALTK